jgi:ring-1,2-phenylacetyl-CoA epoxidase subunit PaaD
MEYNTNKQETTTNAKVQIEITCPFCRSTDTELFSLFGQQLLTVQFYCNACHTPFECVKDDDILDAYDVARKEGQL